MQKAKSETLCRGCLWLQFSICSSSDIKMQLIEREREVVTSRCHGSKMFGSQQTVALQIWQKNKNEKIVLCVFPVHDCTQEQNGSP